MSWELDKERLEGIRRDTNVPWGSGGRRSSRSILAGAPGARFLFGTQPNLRHCSSTLIAR